MKIQSPHLVLGRRDLLNLPPPARAARGTLNMLVVRQPADLATQAGAFAAAVDKILYNDEGNQ